MDFTILGWALFAAQSGVTLLFMYLWLTRTRRLRKLWDALPAELQTRLAALGPRK